MREWLTISYVLCFLSAELYGNEPKGNEEIEEGIEGEYTTIVKSQRDKNSTDTADTVIISGEDILNSSRGSLLEAVSQSSADIYVTASKVGFHGIAAGASGSINVRGLGGSPNTQVLIVEDGLPDLQGIFGHPMPDAYTPELLSAVKVIKGGDSVRYGSNAMGAVLIMDPLFKREEGVELTIDSAFGSFNTVRNRLVLLGATESLDYSASYSSFASDGHRDFAGGRTDVINIGLRYRLSSSFRVKLFNKTVWLSGFDPGPASHPYSDHYYDVFRDNLHLKLEYKRGILNLSLTPFIHGGEHRLFDGFRSIDYEGGLILEAEARLHKNINTILGLSTITNGGYFENRIQNIRSGFEDLSGYAIYNQVEMVLPLRISIQAGLREHYSPLYGSFFLYQGGVYHKLYNYFFIRSRIAKNFRQPTIRELYFPFPVANPELKPEESLSRDVEIGYDDGVFSMSFTYYKTDAKNLIKYFGAWPTVESVNIDEYNVPGIEANITLKNPLGMSLYISFNSQDVGRYTKQNPSTKLDMGFTYKNYRGGDAYTLSLNMEYVSGLFEKNYSRDPMKDVFFADLSGSYDLSIFTTPASIYLIVRNALDMKYEYIVDYPMPGINFLCGLRLKI